MTRIRCGTAEPLATLLRAEYDKWGKVIGALKRQDTFSRRISGSRAPGEGVKVADNRLP